MAEQLNFSGADPCRGICQTDERELLSRLFPGSREERFNWQTMSDARETGGFASLPPTAAAQNTREQAGAGGRTAATLTVLSQKLRILREHFLLRKRLWFSVAMAPRGPEFSRVL